MTKKEKSSKKDDILKSKKYEKPTLTKHQRSQRMSRMGIGGSLPSAS